SRAGGRRRLMKLRIVDARLLQRRNIVVREFHPAVHRQYVIRVDCHSARRSAARYTGNLFLVFLSYLVPEKLAGSLAIKLPVAIGHVLEVLLEHSQSVLYFAGEKVAVLVAHVLGRAFEMNVNPSCSLDAKRASSRSRF